MTPIPYFNDKKEVVSWQELMSLDDLGNDKYQSRVQPYRATLGGNGAFGGHVYAQSVWAAAQTVEPGFLIHNVTGWFTLGGVPSKHFVYSVQRIRDGYGYVTRTVTVVQEPEKGVMFTCTCSFKRADNTDLDFQDNTSLDKIYGDVADFKDPMGHPPAPSLDDPIIIKRIAAELPNHYNPIPGLHLRRVPMDDWCSARPIIDRRRLTFYSLRGTLPSPYQGSRNATIAAVSRDQRICSREANLHAAAHLYASDRNSALVITNNLELELAKAKTLASLAHTVIFHAGVEKLSMTDEPVARDARADPTAAYSGSEKSKNKSGERDWFMQEMWTTRVGDGRGIHTSRLFDVKTGCHIATTIQDVIARFKPGVKL